MSAYQYQAVSSSVAEKQATNSHARNRCFWWLSASFLVFILASAFCATPAAAWAESHVPPNMQGSMGTTGNAYILGAVVEFPAEGEEAATVFDDAAAQAANFVAAVEGTSATGDATGANTPSYSFPYESLNAYYQRSSYGKLNIGCRGACYTVVAQHCRNYYTSRENELLLEIANYLDTVCNVDFSQYDGNNDGMVDGFYVVFAGETTGWRTTWWPNEFNLGNEGSSISPYYDGKTLNSIVLMNGITNTGGVGTLIHETGHVLGLEDYYSNEGQTKGIGTADMMNDNIGDQNAFSKWVLGWIDESDITRVAVTSAGIKVRRGGGDVKTYDSGKSVVETLQAFTSNDISECGGFIAVSGEESILSDDLHCSYYLLQYDQKAGNQAYSNNGGLVAGLRVYRVQAQLNEEGLNFKKSCSSATNQHDMLIEALKPSDGGAEQQVGDAFHTGDVIGVSTTPSTNFREDTLGYTGIHIEVTNADNPESAVITLSYEEQPAEQKFSVTPAFTSGLLDIGAYYFKLTAQPNWEASSLKGATLVVDGTEYAVNVQAADSRLLMYYTFANGTITQDSSCELVLPAGFFDLYGKQSEEIHVALEPRSKTFSFADAGAWDATTHHNYGEGDTLSYATTVNNEQVMVAATNNENGGYQLRILKLSSNGETCQVLPVSGVLLEHIFLNSVQVLPLDQGRLFVYVQGSSKTGTVNKAFWVDRETGALLDERDISTMGFSAIAAQGNSVLLLRSAAAYSMGCEITQIFSSDESADKHLSGASSIPGMRLLGLEDGRIVSITSIIGLAEGTVGVYSASQIEALLAGEGAGTGADGSTGAGTTTPTPQLSLSIPNSDSIEDVASYNGNVYVLTRCATDSNPRLELHVFDSTGALVRTTKMEGSSTTYGTTSHLTMGQAGAAVITTKTVNTDDIANKPMEIAVVSPDGSFAGYTSTTRDSIAFWADECLYVTQRSIDSAADTEKITWVRTAALDTAGSGSGSGAGGGSGSAAGDTAGTSAAGTATIPQTGDSTLAFFLLTTCLAGLCLKKMRATGLQER